MTAVIPLLNVEDVARSLAFYRTVLGAEVERQWEHEGRIRWARIRFAGGTLMLNTPDHVDSTERRDRGEFSDVVLYVTCDDASALRTRLVRAGIAVGEVTHEEYGSDELPVRDPDGYAIRFTSLSARATSVSAGAE